MRISRLFIVICLIFVQALSKKAARQFPTKILGGSLARPKDYLYMASLSVRGRFICGAIAVSPHWALTAAHCLDDGVEPEDVLLRAGSKIRSGGGTIHTVSAIFMHPEYEASLNNDIALIKVNNPFKEGRRMKFIRIQENTVLRTGSEVTVVGWGKISLDDEYDRGSNYLMEVKLQIVSNSYCQWKQRYSMWFVVTNKMICAYREGKDSTEGDSGGPLIYRDRRRGEDILVGIVAGGEGKGNLSGLGIYTRVGSYISWIRNIVKKYTYADKDDNEDYGNGATKGNGRSLGFFNRRYKLRIPMPVSFYF